MITLKSIYEEMMMKELDVSNDPELSKAVNEFAKLSDEMNTLEAKMKELEGKMRPLDDKLRPVLEKLAETNDRILETKDAVVKINKLAYDRENIKYKEAFLWLFERVNQKMKDLITEAMKANTTWTRVKASISAIWKHEGTINELSFADVKDKIFGFFKNIFSTAKSLDTDLDKLNALIKKMK